MKEFENIFKKIKREDKDFSSHQRDLENFEQNNESIVLNALFAAQNSEEITLIYKSEHHCNGENNALLLMITDDEKYYCFAAKSKLELYSSEWLRRKKESITNKDNCFQNALNDSLGYQKIKKHSQKISKLKPYINQYNWKGIKFRSDKKDWKKFEENNKEIALSILFVPHNKKKLEIILLMITDDSNRSHYLAVKTLPALLRGITSNHHRDFNCLNCFHSYTTHNKLKKHERVCNNHDYYRVDMPKKQEKIKYSPGEKSLKALFIIYVDLECLLKKIQSCKNNPKIFIQRKKLCTNHQDMHGVQYAHLMIQKTDAIFIGEKFFKDLKELGMKIINFEEKEMIPLRNKEIKSYEKQKVCHICKKEFCDDKNNKKVRDHCHYTGKF